MVTFNMDGVDHRLCTFMPAKITDHATDFRVVDRWDGGVGLMAHPTELMQRTSHALATDDGVVIVDPGIS